MIELVSIKTTSSAFREMNHFPCSEVLIESFGNSHEETNQHAICAF